MQTLPFADAAKATAISRPRARSITIAVAAAVMVALVVTIGLVSSRGGSSAPASSANVDMDGLRYNPDQLVVRPGKVRLHVRNNDAITHTFTVTGLGVDLQLGAGEEAEVDVDASLGVYDIVCTVPGHLDAGMRGELRVS